MSLLRLQRLPRPGAAAGCAADVDPLLHGNLEAWPHLLELVQCYKGDLIHVDNKYGHYESVPAPPLEPQVFESQGPEHGCSPSAIPALAVAESPLPPRAPHSPAASQNFSPQTPGSLPPLPKIIIQPDTNGHAHFLGLAIEPKTPEDITVDREKDSGHQEHLGYSPMVTYDPIFSWEHERSVFQGNRAPGPPNVTTPCGMKFSVRVLSLTIQAGLVEPIYGTICLYHNNRKEKLSEDFYFQFLPPDWPGESTSPEKRAIFSLDAPSASVFLLVQMEKPATEESPTGVRSNVYARETPPMLNEKEKKQLQKWAQVMPFRESFAWTTIPLFDANVTGGVGGFGSITPSSASSVASSTSSSGMSTPVSTEGGSTTPGGGPDNPPLVVEQGGPPVLVDIPVFNRIKDCYTEDQLQDPKRKAHKPVRATMRFEIERLPQDLSSYQLPAGVVRMKRPAALDRSMSLDSNASFAISIESPQGNGHHPHTFPSLSTDGVLLWEKMDIKGFRALDFRSISRSEPLSQVLHCLYVYPQSIAVTKKRNLFIRVELRNDDSDFNKPALEAIFPRGDEGPMLRSAYSQVASSMKVCLFHDEFKIRLPAIITTQHHLLFTFFHVDLLLKTEPPKPVVVGYSVVPLAMGAQVLKSDGSLPIIKELMPNYLLESTKQSLSYWEEGKPQFRLRLRLCSSVYPINSKAREFFNEYDKHILKTSSSVGSDLLDSINSLKNVDTNSILQYLQPILNMLLRMIGDGGETLQVAAFRAVVNVLSRVQHESGDTADRSKYLVHYVDYAYDDCETRAQPVYPGLCSVWRSLARSKAKGYRVGPVYEDVLSMAWVFLELLVKSMAVELAHSVNDTESGEVKPPLQLKDDVFRCIWQLFECLLAEVQERAKKGLALTRRLNRSLAFFCYDLLSVVDPHQVYDLVALYLDKFQGVQQQVLQDCKLTFLGIISDHDLYLELPGRVPSEKNYLSAVVLHELVATLDHEEFHLRSKAARILASLMCKHENDVKYQSKEDKMHIAQLYLPLINLVLDRWGTFSTLGHTEKRDELVCVLMVLRYVDDQSLLELWQQSPEHSRLFFKLLEESLMLFGRNKPVVEAIPGPKLPSPEDDAGTSSPNYSNKLAPSTDWFLSEASRVDNKVQTAGENAFLLRKLSQSSQMQLALAGQLSSPSSFGPVRAPLRDALTQPQISRKEAVRALRDSLHPVLKSKLVVWEDNMSLAVSLQVVEILRRFSAAVSARQVQTDYDKLECFTAVLTILLSKGQYLTFWKTFLPIFSELLSSQGAVLLSPVNNRFQKDVAFYFVRLLVSKTEFLRKGAIAALYILLNNGHTNFRSTERLQVMLIMTLSELISDVPVLTKNLRGVLEESEEIARLRLSLAELGRLEGVPTTTAASPATTAASIVGLEGIADTIKPALSISEERSWRQHVLGELKDSLVEVLEAQLEHSRLAMLSVADKYVMAESFYALARAYRRVPDLQIMWLLHLCNNHQENESWAEAAQCAVAVVGVILRMLVSVGGSKTWTLEHLDTLRRICPVRMLDGIEDPNNSTAGLGTTKLTADSAIRYLQMAYGFFVKAELYSFCSDLLELQIPAFKSRRAFGQLARVHMSLTSIYESIQEQEGRSIPFKDATYYRVGFYGDRFGRLNKKEFIYREARDVRLGDMVERLGKVYEKRYDYDVPLQIFPDSRNIKPEELQPGFAYLQITSVEPVVGSEEECWKGKPPETVAAAAPSYKRFLFDTPFTTNGKSQAGGLEDQWKRRTILESESPFPALVKRLQVVKSESREYSPLECAVSMIESRTQALQNELSVAASSGADYAPRAQVLQRMLQGSVAVQVNSGMLGVCMAFLSPVGPERQPQPRPHLSPANVPLLAEAIRSFISVCKEAINVHTRVMREGDLEFHKELVFGLQTLTTEISAFLPGIAEVVRGSRPSSRAPSLTLDRTAKPSVTGL
eukprot:SM000030S11490  [mRNA]  locus=s30:801352:813323:- [translate_table: standard]